MDGEREEQFEEEPEAETEGEDESDAGDILGEMDGGEPSDDRYSL